MCVCEREKEIRNIFRNLNASSPKKIITSAEVVQFMKNKTGFQPVSRPVEQFHNFGGWVEGAKSLWCQGLSRQINTWD